MICGPNLSKLSAHTLESTESSPPGWPCCSRQLRSGNRSEEHTSELQSHHDLVCRLLLEKKKRQSQNSRHACNALDPSRARCFTFAEALVDPPRCRCNSAAPQLAHCRTTAPVLPLITRHE